MIGWACRAVWVISGLFKSAVSLSVLARIRCCSASGEGHRWPGAMNRVLLGEIGGHVGAASALSLGIVPGT